MTGHYSLFWIVSGLVFFANALFSLVEGYWLLSLLQMVTAGMAAIAAIYGSDTNEPDNSNPARRNDLH